MKKILTLMCACVLAICSIAHSADINVEWKQVANADGYKIQTSEDLGATWTEVPSLVWTPFTEGLVEKAEATITVADNVLVLVRAGAYDSIATIWRYEHGIFYNSAWQPLNAPTGLGAN